MTPASPHPSPHPATPSAPSSCPVCLGCCEKLPVELGQATAAKLCQGQHEDLVLGLSGHISRHWIEGYFDVDELLCIIPRSCVQTSVVLLMVLPVT